MDQQCPSAAETTAHPRDWTTALERYREVGETLRGFTLDEHGRARPRVPSVAADRFRVFDTALSTPPPLARRAGRPAQPGVYTTTAGGRTVSVTVPRDLPRSPVPRGHDPNPRTDRGPVTFTWEELARTAELLDEREEAAGIPGTERGHWRERFARLRLRCRRGDWFADSRVLEIGGVLHLIGMVGAGKSTLMLLAAVCAAERGQRVTVVVGDVLSALRHMIWLRAVGIAAAPVVGASTQEQHINRLLQVHASTPCTGSALQDFEPVHDLLSTACALDGLREGAGEPWPFRDAPCRGHLLPLNAPEQKTKSFDCPLWASCQRHTNARALVDAAVWVATPASLVHSRVPRELNAEQLRYLELVWRRSDLVIVDEADLVQAQLDAMFSPSHTLVGHESEAWLELLADHTERELRTQGRAQFASRPVREWSALLDTARSTANRLYALLQRHPLPRGQSTIRAWIGRDCFTEWTLADKLVRDWAGVASADPEHPGYQKLRPHSMSSCPTRWVVGDARRTTRWPSA